MERDIIKTKIKQFMKIEKAENRSDLFQLKINDDNIEVYREYYNLGYRDYIIKVNNIPLCTTCNDLKEVKRWLRNRYKLVSN